MLIELLGWAGTLCILGSFYYATTHKPNRPYWYVNLIGCLLLLVNVWYHRAIPSVAINAVWALIAIRGLWVSRPLLTPEQKAGRLVARNGIRIGSSKRHGMTGEQRKAAQQSLRQSKIVWTSDKSYEVWENIDGVGMVRQWCDDPDCDPRQHVLFRRTI